MKCYKKVLIVLLFSIVLLGCAQKTDKNKADVNTDDFTVDEQVEYSYTHGIKDYDGRTIKIDNSNFDLEYEVKNNGSQVDLGLMVFVDGEAQNIKVGKEVYQLYRFNLDENEIKDIDLSLQLKSGMKGDKKQLYFAVFLKPDANIQSLKDIGNNYSLSQPMAIPLEFDINIARKQDNPLESHMKCSIKQMNKQEKEKYIKNYHDESVNQLDSMCFLSYLENGNELDDIFHNNVPHQLQLCGIPGKYKLITFEDFKITSYTDVEIKKDSYTIVDSYKINEKTKNIFSILIPMDNLDNMITQSKILIGGE